jgi:hypothetical protein
MSGTDFEKLSIVLSVRDRELAKAMDRNTKRIDRFERNANKKLSAASQNFDGMTKAVLRGGTALAGLFVSRVTIQSLRNTVSQLDSIGKTADKLGLTTSALQELRAAGESAGVSQKTLDMAMQRFGRRLAEARKGKGEAKDALAEMKIEMFDASGQALSLENVLGQVADRMSEMTSQTDRNRLAMKLFDSEGVALVNLLREGSAGMDEMRREARELGIVIDESLIRKAEESQNKLDLMSKVIDAQLASALINLAPLLVNTAEWLAGITKAASEFLKLNSNIGDDGSGNALQERAAALAGVTDELERYNNAIAAADELPTTYGQFSGDAEQLRVAQELVDAEKELLKVVRAREAEARAVTGIQGVAAEIEAAKEVTRLREMGAEAAERERIAKEKTAMIEKLMADVRASGNGVVSGVVSQQVKDLADRWEEAQVSASKILNPIERAGSATDRARSSAESYEQVIARIAGLAGKDLSDAGFATVLAEIDALMRSGVIDGDQYADMISSVEDRFKGAARAASEIQSNAKSAFAAVLSGSKSAQDAVADLLVQMASLAAESAFTSLLGGGNGWNWLGSLFGGGFGGGGGGGKLPSFDGGGGTGNGARTGGLDGKGGFLAMLHPQESVVDHTRGRGRSVAAPVSPSSINVTVNGARGNTEISEMVHRGVQQGLQQYDRAVIPGRVNQVSRDRRRVK